MTGLTDLPPDALLHLLALLPLRDVFALSSTCTVLRSCAHQVPSAGRADSWAEQQPGAV